MKKEEFREALYKSHREGQRSAGIDPDHSAAWDYADVHLGRLTTTEPGITEIEGELSHPDYEGIAKVIAEIQKVFQSCGPVHHENLIKCIIQLMPGKIIKKEENE